MKENKISSDDKIIHALRLRQRGLRWLTGVAIGFWVCAVIASAVVLGGYTVFYQPKERQMMADYERHGHIARHGQPAGQERPKLSVEEALALHFTMNYVMTKGILAVAVSVLILSCGTLSTLLLVVINRRMTLKQINESLALISDELRRLQSAQTSAGRT